jgi:hypothetical protein
MTDEPDSEPANPEEGAQSFFFINCLLFYFSMNI